MRKKIAYVGRRHGYHPVCEVIYGENDMYEQFTPDCPRIKSGVIRATFHFLQHHL
jgi:hypothetical protein